MGFLHDSILFGDNYDESRAAVLRAVNLLQSLGLQNYPEKYFLTPKQEINFLGFTLNSKNMTLKLTKQKCNKFLENLDVTLKHAKSVTLSFLLKV